MGDKLFSYAVILHPTKKDQEENEAKSKVLISPTAYELFSSEHAAQMTAINAIGELPAAADRPEGKQLLRDAAERLEVAVRPF